METRVVHKGKSIYKSPIAGWFIMGEIPPKWMRTRGTPILGNLHFDIRKKGKMPSTKRWRFPCMTSSKSGIIFQMVCFHTKGTHFINTKVTYFRKMCFVVRKSTQNEVQQTFLTAESHPA